MSSGSGGSSATAAVPLLPLHKDAHGIRMGEIATTVVLQQFVADNKCRKDSIWAPLQKITIEFIMSSSPRSISANVCSSSCCIDAIQRIFIAGQHICGKEKTALHFFKFSLVFFVKEQFILSIVLLSFI